MSVENIVLWYSILAGDVLIPLIVIAFIAGLLVLFKRHYLVESEHQFAAALQKRTHELIDLQYKEQKTKEFSEIVWYVLRKASSERDKVVSTPTSKPAKKSDSNSSGPFGGGASSNPSSGPFGGGASSNPSSGPFGGGASDSKASADSMKKAAGASKQKPTFKQVFKSYFDEKFAVEQGIQKIIDNTLEQTMYYKLSQDAPNFLNIASYAFTYNPYFQKIWRSLTVDTANSLLKTWHEIIVMLGILGTFIGFFLAFQSGGDLKAGVSIAITSSIVGLTLGIGFMLIEKSFTDDETSMNSVEIFKDSLELIWNNSKALYEKKST
ncbi:MAG: hypothetical protein HQM14_05655 [SAR324 cluster bacterium]|nr:hypothetical protein [SAR324 cluster bacterium]